MKKTFKLLTIFCSSFLFLFLMTVQTTVSDEEENQCAACHTSGRKLMQTTKEMAAMGKEAPAESAESVGEG